MQLTLGSVLTALAACQLVHADDKKHGQGSEGTVMGPVAFMWPDDRKYACFLPFVPSGASLRLEVRIRRG